MKSAAHGQQNCVCHCSKILEGDTRKGIVIYLKSTRVSVQSSELVPPSPPPQVTVSPKGVGPSTTLAWPGWKQPDIPVEVDTARLETSRTVAGVLKKLRLASIAKLSRLKYS